MFGKKKDDEMAADQSKDTAEVQPRNYQAQPASRPAVNPEIARRGRFDPVLVLPGAGRGAGAVLPCLRRRPASG